MTVLGSIFDTKKVYSLGVLSICPHCNGEQSVDVGDGGGLVGEAIVLKHGSGRGG